MAYIGKSPSVGVRNRYYFTATGGETSLSGSDDNGNTFNFRDGAYVDVSLNGVRLVAGDDYNTTTANTISGLSALGSGDIVEVIVYDIFVVSDTVSSRYGGFFRDTVTFQNGLVADSATFTRIGGDLIPNADSTYDLGSSSLKWKDLYLSGSSIYLGDVVLKDQNGVIAITNASGNPIDLTARSLSADSATITSLAVTTITGDGTGLTGVPRNLDSLGDVSTVGATDGQVLTYTSGSFSFDSAASSMAALSDVNLTGLQDGQSIVYDAGTGQFQADSNVSNITKYALWENASVISANYTIATGNNAISAGPIQVDSGVSVTVPTGSRWVVT